MDRDVLNLSHCRDSLRQLERGAIISLAVVLMRESVLLEAPVEYTVTAAFLLAVVAGCFTVVIFGGYELVQLISSVL